MQSSFTKSASWREAEGLARNPEHSGSKWVSIPRRSHCRWSPERMVWERTMLEGGHELFMLEAEEKSKGFALEGKTEDEMLAEAVPFYQNLFSKRETSAGALSRIGYFIKHDEEPFSSLAEPFNEEECLRNSKAMHVGKSPGPDGLPVEFWSKIWPLVVSAFVLICNEAHVCMPQSWKQGQLRLIPKKDKLQTIGDA